MKSVTTRIRAEATNGAQPSGEWQCLNFEYECVDLDGRKVADRL
jgi:hypothetical protein